MKLEEEREKRRKIFRPIVLLAFFSLGACSKFPSDQASKPAIENFVLLDAWGREYVLYKEEVGKKISFVKVNETCSSEQLKKFKDHGNSSGKVRFLWSGELHQPFDKNSEILILEDTAGIGARVLGLNQCGDSLTVEAGNWSHFDRRQSSLAENTSVSFSKDIAPIFVSKCLHCHISGGVAPWQMTNYEAVKGWSKMIREVVLIGRMPPWGHNTKVSPKISNLPALTEEERAKVVDWVAAGAKKDFVDGDPLEKGYEQTKEKFKKLNQEAMKRERFTLPPIKHLIKANAPESWTDVNIDFNFETDKWVRAAYVVPSNPKVVHHAFLFIDYPKERKGEQPLWVKGMGIDGNNGFFAAFGPGYRGEYLGAFPEGTGKLIPKGAKGRMQVHFVSTGKDENSEIELHLEFLKKKPDKVFQVMSSQDQGFVIPAGAGDIPFQTEIPVKKSIDIHEVCPHMHLRGKYMNYYLKQNGTEKLFFSLPRFRPNWQSCFRFERAMRVAPGSTIVVRGAFDNSAKNPFNPDPQKEVRFGPNSTDEMFLPFIGYTEN